MNTSMPFQPTIPALAQWLAETYPDELQVADGAGGATFAEVRRRSGVLARALIAQGVGKGAQIGLMLPNGVDWVALWLAIERIGATAVLMSTFAKAPEIAHMLRHGDVAMLISADSFLGNDYPERLETGLPSLKGADGRKPLYLPEAPSLRAIWIWGGATPPWAKGGKADFEAAAATPGIDDAFLAAVESEVTAADRALIMYTSGTTAAPKAVVHTQGTVARHSWTISRHMAFSRGDRLMTTMPLFWVGGLCTGLLVANLQGAALICPQSPSESGMLDTLRTREVTHIALWPLQMQSLRAHPDFQPEDFARLKPTSSIQQAIFGISPPELTPNVLGMSESFGPHSIEPSGMILEPHASGSFGRAAGDVERIIVDPVTKQVLPYGEEGELWIRGSQVMAGLYKRERSEVFEPDGFLRTGDFARLREDGHLFFTGRRTEMIKTSGANVAPREVELALAAQPEVMEAAVLGAPDPRAGEIVVAAVILRPGHAGDEADLRQRVLSQVATYKAPRRIFFLTEEEIPRTQSAKVNKVRLLELLRPRLS